MEAHYITVYKLLGVKELPPDAETLDLVALPNTTLMSNSLPSLIRTALISIGLWLLPAGFLVDCSVLSKRGRRRNG